MLLKNISVQLLKCNFNFRVLNNYTRKFNNNIIATRNMTSIANNNEDEKESFKMTNHEKFLFDLNGFIVLRNVLNEDEVKEMNDAIDANIHKAVRRETKGLKNAVVNSKLSADGSRIDLGGMLGWEKPHGDPFRRLLVHRKLAPYITALCGEGYRLDHHPLVILQGRNSEGFSLHGGPLSGHDGVPEGRFNPELQYNCRNGSIWNSLLAMSVSLCDSDSGDGGFCVLRGSHKLNFAVPEKFSIGELKGFDDHIYQPAMKKGDVIFFSEATVHGAMAWKRDEQRRLALYRFAPSNFAYGRGYLNNFGEDVLEKCTPQQKAVLQPPFAVRLQRKTLTEQGEDGEVKQYKRSEVKMKHDVAVFGSTYF